MRNSYEFEKCSTNVSFISTYNNEKKQMNNKYEIQNKHLIYELKDEIICHICLNFVNNPKFCSKCEVLFCSDCIQKWLIFNSTCPQKCKNIIVKDISLIFKQILDKIIIKCKYGCKIRTE